MFLTQKEDKRFSDPVLLDYIAFHTLTEIHGGILVQLVILKDFFFNVGYFPNNFQYASSPVKSKALWEEINTCMYVICPSFLPHDS